MPIPKAAVDAQLAPLLPRFQLSLAKRELAALPEVLMPGETMHALTTGNHAGKQHLVVVTNWRVLFLHRGPLGGASQLDLPIGKIQGASHSVGLLLGDISIATAGAVCRITNTPKIGTQAFAEALNALVAQQAGPGAPAVSAPTDRITQLERLGHLRTTGVLSEQEFQAEKSRLLGL